MNLSSWVCPVDLDIYHIQPESKTGSDKDPGKTRVFRSSMVSYVILEDCSWKDTEVTPDLVAFVGSELELKAFIANLKLGHSACKPKSYMWEKKQESISIPKGMSSHTVKTSSGSVWIGYTESLFTWVPSGVDPDRVDFVVLPSVKWVSQNSFSDEEVERTRNDLRVAMERLLKKYDHDYGRHYINSSDLYSSIYDLDSTRIRQYMVYGALLLGHLDRRSRIPIPFDIGLGVYLYWFLQMKGNIQYLKDNTEKVQGLSFIGLTSGFRLSIKHDVLSEQVSQCVLEWRHCGQA